MSNITEIQRAILGLPKADYVQLRNWLNEVDWEEWEQQIDADASNGRLEFLIAEAEEAKEHEMLQEF